MGIPAATGRTKAMTRSLASDGAAAHCQVNRYMAFPMSDSYPLALLIRQAERPLLRSDDPDSASRPCQKLVVLRRGSWAAVAPGAPSRWVFHFKAKSTRAPSATFDPLNLFIILVLVLLRRRPFIRLSYDSSYSFEPSFSVMRDFDLGVKCLSFTAVLFHSGSWASHACSALPTPLQIIT